MTGLARRCPVAPLRAMNTTEGSRFAGDTLRVASDTQPIMETNDLGFVASLMFVLVPTVFLLVLYIQTSSRQGG